MLILVRSEIPRHLWWVVSAGVLFGHSFPSLSCRKCFLFQHILVLCWEPGSKREADPSAPLQVYARSGPLWPAWPWASAIKEVIYTASFFFPTKCSLRLDSRLAQGRRRACFMSVYLSVFPFMAVLPMLRWPWLDYSVSSQTNIRYTFVCLTRSSNRSGSILHSLATAILITARLVILLTLRLISTPICVAYIPACSCDWFD